MQFLPDFRWYRLALLLFALLPTGVLSVAVQTWGPNYPDLYEASILELQTGLEKSQFTSVDLVKVSLP
jgi:hypothetical protein